MPEDSTQPQTTPEGKSINWKRILIGAVIGAVLVGIIGALVFYLYQSNQEETNPTTTPKTSTPSAKIATPSAEKDETVDWKIFVYKEGNYSISLPPNWTFTPGFLGSGSLITDKTGKINPADENHLTIEINISENIPAKSLREHLKTVGGFDSQTVDNATNATVDSIDGLKLEGILLSSDGKVATKTTVIAVPKGDKVYSFVAYPPDSNMINKFEQILSTFKFLN